MFTGIIESTAEILQKTPTGFRIARPADFTDLKLGSSVAVSGACLTVAAMDDASLSFDVVDETWKRTALGGLEEGDRVNLERAMRADGRFDGHVVQGHVEGVAEIAEVKKAQTGAEITFCIPGALLPFMIEKGSVTLDGISLTIARLEGDRLTVAVIPETLARTSLGWKKEGEKVNVETDLFVRAVMKARA